MTAAGRALLPALVVTFLLSPASAAAAETVELEAADGHRLTGTLWPDDDAPGVLLLHQCNNSRKMYEELGAKLAAAGFKVLAIDFRGFGDSKGGGYDLTDAAREDWQRAMAGFPLDAEAAYAFLAAHGSGAVAGALGASCGGREVVTLAQQHPELARLGFFSSGLDDLQKRDLQQMRDRNMLFIAAQGDGPAATSAGIVAYRLGKQRSELFLYDGDAHGYPLFAQDPMLVDKIVAFYKPLLD